MTSATGSINAFFDTLPRTRVAIQGRELPAFRCCGTAGFYAALMVSAAGTLLTGRSLVLTAFVAVVCAASFFIWALLRRWVGGREELVLLEHVWFAVALSAAALRLVGAPVLAYLDIMSPALAIFLAAGRIGCTLVGCCHGQPGEVGLVYGADAVADGFPRALAGIRLFPVPLIEAAGLAAIAVSGLCALPFAPPGRVLAWYLAAYAVMRFGLEGLRGDRRPHWLGLSQSRWMCVAELVFAGILSGAAVNPLVWVVLALALAAGLIWKRTNDLGRRLLSADAVRELRDLLEQVANECGRNGTAGPAAGKTSLGVSVAVSISGKQAHVSLSLPKERCDLRLLCDVAARVLPTSIPAQSAYSERRILHVLLPVPLERGSLEGRQAEEFGLTLYGLLLRPLPGNVRQEGTRRL